MTENPISIIRERYPTVDEEIFNYLEGILEDLSDFSDGDELHDSIGTFLVDSVGADREDEIRELCGSIMAACTVSAGERSSGGGATRLAAPLQLADMAQEQEANEAKETSVWIVEKSDALKVDAKKLEKAEAKIKEKREKRGNESRSKPLPAIVQTMATATQEVSKKDRALDAKGGSNTKDIRIENFDVAFADKVLIESATISLAFGRRYALIGRNGLGKTTLLRMIAHRVLRIPAHISILHVEQEVVADDTTALDSVLECDTVRHGLLTEERAIQAQITDGSAPPGVADRLNEIYAKLESIEADKAPARASVILCGLGFSTLMQRQATKKFSGGWRMRIALARALFSQPDLLLLDEPTNMLDLKAIIWLENYLLTWPTTLFLVSHDRHFLDAVPTDILDLRARTITPYRGNYENFLNIREDRLKNQQREYDSQMMFRAHAQEFIDKFRFNAKRASLVQSKIKLLEKLPELKPVEKETSIVFAFPEVEKIAPPVLQLDEVSFRYSEDRPYLFHNVDLQSSMESRICIVGDNGAGKTTLLKILLGELDPTKGHRHCSRNLQVGYFSQHHVDQLNLRLSGVTLLQERFPGKPIEEYRRQLGRFGVSGDLALQQLASLSGGQKSRVAFAAMAAASPNFLILDEPTNHLDIETIEALGNAIKLYKGGVVLVSHDERLIRQVCTELWVCGDQRVRCVQGGFDAYRKLVEAEMAEAEK